MLKISCFLWPAERNFTHNAHQRLLQHLFAGYDRDGHPGGGISVKVWVGAKVVRIVNIVSIDRIPSLQSKCGIRFPVPFIDKPILDYN